MGVKKAYGNKRQPCGTGAVPGKLIRSGMVVTAHGLLCASYVAWAPGLSMACQRFKAGLPVPAHRRTRITKRGLSLHAARILALPTRFAKSLHQQEYHHAGIRHTIVLPIPGRARNLAWTHVMADDWPRRMQRLPWPDNNSPHRTRAACLMHTDGGLSWFVVSLGCRAGKAGRA